MTVRELKANIIANNLENLYIFYGPEYIVQKVYISKIAKQLNSEIQYIESLAEIKQYAGQSLFASKKCFVCLDNTELLKSNDINGDFAKIQQILGENCLILTFSKLDKRSKFYSQVEARATEFQLLHPVVLEKHLRENLEILPPTAQKLAEVCEYDYGRCLLEIDKIKNYNAEEPNKAFKELLDNGVIYQPPGDKIFDFVNAVLSGNPRLAFDLLQECKEIGEPSLRLLLVLFTNIKHLLQVQSCEQNIAETTGLSSWEIRCVQNYQGIYRNSELVKAMKIIREVEKGIKIGKIEDSIAVDYVLVNIM